MRNIERIIVHCSATKPSMDIGAKQIRRWHLDRRWSDIGYHYVIRRDGTLEGGRPLWRAGAHAVGHNHDSIGVCLVGGVDERGRADANFTIMQYNTLLRFIKTHSKKHRIKDILGHRDLPDVKKSCPCFDVRSFLHRS
jgi:N-acetyl-anhydromuramyl-L-alanine amidase AmpD